MPLVSAEEQEKQQERGKAYTTVTGGELGAANQQEQTQRQTQNVNERIPTGGIQFSKPSEPLDLSRGQVPFMAQGFTPKGEPYYGGGVKGYLRGAFARIFDPEPLQEGFNQQQRDAIKSASQETTQKVVEALPFLSDYKEYVNAYTTSALSAAESPGKLLGQAGKVAKETLFGGLTLIQEGEKPFRNQFSAQAAFGDIAQSYGETQTVMPKLKKYGDWRDFFTQNAPVTVSQNLHRIAEGKRAQGENFNAFLADTGAIIAALPVLGPISPQLATWLGEKSLDKVETQRFNSYMKGSRMIYSLAIDEGKKQEYIRRVEEGANVDFLIEEMQNPWAELAGGLVFDMLNFLPSPAKSSRLASAGDEFAKIVDPDIAKAVEAGTKVFADDDVLPIAQKVSKVITDRIAQASEKMVSWGQAKHAYSIFNPTASSKQYLVSRRVGTVLEFIGKNASSADEGAEVASMMLRAAKGSQDAQAYLLKSKYAHMIFSQAGVDTMAMLGKLSDELGDTAKFLERLKGTSSADELLQILSPAMTKTIENMLPSLGDMRNAEKAVAAGTATAIEKNMAAQLKDVGPAIKAAEAVNQKLGKVYAPINRFFAGVYMGLSPGYAFRNLMSDTMAVFTDQGAVSAAKNIGGNIGDLFSKGAVTQRRIDDLAKLGIAAPSAALAGKGAHAGVQGAEKSKKFLGIFPDMRAVAESFEQGSSVNIFANAVEREMKRAVKSGILPDLSPLREQGVTKEAVDELLRLTLKHKGNVKSAVKEWKQFATDGKLLMRKQIPLAENARGLLSQFGLESKLDDLLDSTPDEFRRGVDEIREALAKHSEKVTAAEAHTSDEAAQELVNFEQALLDFKDETIPLDERLFRARRQALNNTISSTDAAFQEAIKHMEVNGLPIADLSTRAMQEMRSRFDEVANRTRVVTDSIFNKTDGLFYRSRKMNGDELKSAWNGVKIHGQDLGDVPELLTGEAFRNAVYDLWKDKTKREWTKAGDNYFENLYGLVKNNAPDFDKIFASETWQKAASNVDEMHYWTDLPSWDQAVPNWMNRTLERINSIPDDVPLTQIRAWELRNQGWTRGKDGLVNLVNKVTGNEGRDVEDIPLKEALRVLQDWRLEYAKSGDLADASKAIQGKASALEDIARTYTGDLPEAAAIAKKYGLTEDDDALRNIVNRFVGAKEDTTKTLETAADVPRSELPENVSQRIAQEARRLISDMFGGEPAGKTALGQLDASKLGAGAEEVGRTATKQSDVFGQKLPGTIEYGTTNPNWYSELPDKLRNKKVLDNALNKIVEDAGKDKGINVERMKNFIIDNFTHGDPASGTPPDLAVLKTLNADDKTMQGALDAFNIITKQNLSMDEALKASGYLPEGFKTLDEIPADIAEKAFAYNEEKLLNAKLFDPKTSPKELARVKARMAELGDIANPVTTEGAIDQLDSLRPPAPAVEDAAPGLPRQLYEQMNQFSDDIGKWSDEVLNRWDETQPAFSNPEIDKVLSQVSIVGEQRFEQAKAFATAVGVSERDFALHKYGDKTYLDVIAGYVFPYQYWYSRSTPKWLRRVVEDPAVIAAYGKYRRTLEGLHAGMPDWWKYNLSTNDLPGVDMENPLYFNLEATLNPVNGITGVDFNDKTKRATWYARLVDDLGKFGPSTFTPISWLVAAGLYNEGETEAAERWMGRFIPATSTLKSVLNLANVDTPLPYNEIDPFVQIFSGGLDPYERRRVGRALSGMVDGVNVTEEMAIDAAYRQSGDLWDQAFQISSDDRALGQISSFAFGVGFKGRKESDIQIDNFYDEYFNLKDMYFGDIVSPAEYKDQLAYLGDKYPFMNTVLLSRRAGEDRETAYSFNVLSRIPPGMSEITQEFGITSDELGAFWDDPYAIDKWDKAKRDRFLGSMYEMSAALQLPDLPTRLDWNAARNTYSAMNDQLKDEFGDKILESIEYFYNEKDKDTARLYLDAHPEVAAALDRKTQLTVLTPNLMKYYGGMDTLDRYLTSKMYDNLEEKYGSDITRVSQEYSDAKYRMFDDKLASQIMRENPNLKAYWKDKAIMRDDVTRKVGLFGSKIEEVRPTIRPDYTGNYKAPEPISFEEWRNVLGDPILQALDNYVRGGNLPKNVKNELDYMAGKYGFGDPYEMASEVLASHVSNTGIPDAYIARDIVNTTPPAMFELIQSGGELPQIVIQQLQEMGGSYGISPEEVLQILLSVQ